MALKAFISLLAAAYSGQPLPAVEASELDATQLLSRRLASVQLPARYTPTEFEISSPDVQAAVGASFARVKPVSSTVYHVTPQQAAALKAEAVATLPTTGSGSTVSTEGAGGWVSTHDAILARVWQAIAGEAAAGCWLLAAGCWLLAAGCWLLAAGCWLLAAGCCLPPKKTTHDPLSALPVKVSPTARPHTSAHPQACPAAKASPTSCP